MEDAIGFLFMLIRGGFWFGVILFGVRFLHGGICLAQAIEVGSGHQLFVDDYLIESENNVTRRLNPAQKRPDNPIFTPEKPWEGSGVILGGSVIYDEQEQVFKMWYGSGWEKETLNYATSPDGIHWERPNVGLIEFEGSTDNNVLLMAEGRMKSATVIKDPDDSNNNRRYKLLVWIAVPNDAEAPPTGPGAGGHYIGWSPDGIHWTLSEEPVLTYRGDHAFDALSLMYDARRKKYVDFTKSNSVNGRRARYICESGDFLNWTKPRLILAVDDNDPGPLHLYKNESFWYETMYLGFLKTFYDTPERNVCETQLISSRDGINWQRAGNREYIIPVGPDGSWDRYNNDVAASAPIRVGDQLYIYYSGRTYRHDGKRGPAQILPRIAIGLATLRVDGFVSVDASALGGSLTTKPLLLNGKQLHLNLKSDFGNTWVELLDEGGNVVEGFSRETCDVIRGDATDHVITWNGNPDLSARAGQPTKIRFYLQNARLYSFWVSK